MEPCSDIWTDHIHILGEENPQNGKHYNHNLTLLDFKIQHEMFLDPLKIDENESVKTRSSQSDQTSTIKTQEYKGYYTHGLTEGIKPSQK